MLAQYELLWRIHYWFHSAETNHLLCAMKTEKEKIQPLSLKTSKFSKKQRTLMKRMCELRKGNN